ncbi:MAG: hypothetical protein IEMM0008_0613 [bacterium]|nr:MAG: hypothetical protein IEMM0008_0613 [bacterium]
MINILMLSIILAFSQVASGQVDWRLAFDFDGDGIMDEVRIDYSGGAHCCYKISVILSSTRKTRRIPFEMDGGYPKGLNLSRKVHFDIQDYDLDGKAEIFMEIDTYSYHKHTIKKGWIKKYGIRNNYILVDFENGRIRYRDWLPPRVLTKDYNHSAWLINIAKGTWKSHYRPSLVRKAIKSIQTPKEAYDRLIKLYPDKVKYCNGWMQGMGLYIFFIEKDYTSPRYPEIISVAPGGKEFTFYDWNTIWGEIIDKK